MDLALFVVEPMGRLNEEETALIDQFRALSLPALLVINKIDLIDQEQLLARIAEISPLYDFAAVLPVSVTEGKGVQDLMEELRKNTEEGPHFFPDDTLTDQPERAIAAEIIREKILRNMRDEIPHGTAVTIEKMRERDNGGILDIEATIYCEKDSHKGMIIGPGRSHAEKDRLRSPGRLGSLPGDQNQPEMLGQGPGRLAQQRKRHQAGGLVYDE